MNLNSEQTTKILHAITADKLQGKKSLLSPLVYSSVSAQVWHKLWISLVRSIQWEQAIFVPSLGLSMYTLLLSIFRTSLS